jgi:hypothetical protein
MLNISCISGKESNLTKLEQKAKSPIGQSIFSAWPSWMKDWLKTQPLESAELLPEFPESYDSTASLAQQNIGAVNPIGKETAC